MTRSPRDGERGLTLTELTIVIVLAGLVTVGLVTFYFNSQATWVDGSTQVLTQRDATALLQAMTDSTRKAVKVVIFDSPDTLHQGLILLDGSDSEWARFWWHPGDSLIHRGAGSPTVDQGPFVTSIAERFQLDADDAMVYVKLLQLRSANGQSVQLSSSMVIQNRP